MSGDDEAVNIRIAGPPGEALDWAGRLLPEAMASAGFDIATDRRPPDVGWHADAQLYEDEEAIAGRGCDVLIVPWAGPAAGTEGDGDGGSASVDPEVGSGRILANNLDDLRAGAVIVLEDALVDTPGFPPSFEARVEEGNWAVYPVDFRGLTGAVAGALPGGADPTDDEEEVLSYAAGIGATAALLGVELEPFAEAVGATTDPGRRERARVVLRTAYESMTLSYEATFQELPQVRVRDQLDRLRKLAESRGTEDASGQALDLRSAMGRLVEAGADSVLVLGKFADEYKDELEAIVDRLDDRGYGAAVADELPEYSEKALEQNIAVYMALSRFCVMVDRAPSGHLVEYEIARRQRDILARLVPEGSGSTYMVGGTEDVDVNHIRAFEFVDDPLERLDDAIEWAERVVEERREAYLNRYPWREDDADEGSR